MLDDWVGHALELSSRPALFYSGARKILRNVSFTFKDLDDDLTLADCGFTKSKMSMLIRNYVVKESIDACLQLWERRLEQKKYGSVGFTTYGHYVKGGGLRNPWEIAQARKTGKPYRASVMGPCIQSVTITLLPDKGSSVDVFYRTTELFKKFPADLVLLRDVLLPPFKLAETAPVREVNFYFANVTLHPMYFITMIPLLADPTRELDAIKISDKHFFDWIIKWSARYIVPKHFRGIQKFAQAMRVRDDALERIKGRTLERLVKYFDDNHPGYRNEYVDPDDKEDGE